MRLEEIFSSKVTENGDLAFNKVGDTLINILFLTEYYQKHLNEVPTLGYSGKEQLFAMFIRDPRFGMGRRDLGRKLMELSKVLPDDIVVAGRYDDLWHIPTDEQFRELKDHTRYKYYNNYNDSGINGMLFTGENGNTIFLPAGGLKHENVVRYSNADGQYWAKNLYKDRRDSAVGFEFNSKYTTTCTSYRCVGYSVRPVLNK